MLAEGVTGGFSAIYPELSQLETLGVARRGYFVEGLGGAQFALPGAVERLRAQAPATRARPSCWPRSTRRSPTAPRCPGPNGRGEESRRPARVAGAYVVLADGEPVVYLERGGADCRRWSDPDDPRLEPALSTLVEHVTRGRDQAAGAREGRRRAGDGLARSGRRCVALGFQAGPRRLTLSA